jgi:arsenate reductase-like glutaredoxin family protein
MLENLTLIKRPVLDNGEQLLVGFNSDNYQDFVSDVHE